MDKGLPRPQEDLKKPQVELGDWVLVKTWQEKGSPSQMSENWTGPYQVVLVTSTAVKVKGLSAWVHNSRIKPYGLTGGRDGDWDSKSRGQLFLWTCWRLLFTWNTIKSPSGKSMHLMTFLLFLIMPSCTAINFSLNDAYMLENHTASWLSVTAPCWICISSRSWGYVLSYPRVSLAHHSSPATCCHPVYPIWSSHGLLGKRGEKLHALVSATAVFIYSHDNICNPTQALIFSLDWHSPSDLPCLS